MTTTDTDALIHRIRHAHRRATDSEWCLEEDCEYRHWTSGGVPTHRRGSTCPPVPTLEAAVLPVVEAEVRAAKAEALRDAANGLLENIDWSDGRSNYGDNDGYEASARELRARATEHEAGGQA